MLLWEEVLERAKPCGLTCSSVQSVDVTSSGDIVVAGLTREEGPDESLLFGGSYFNAESSKREAFLGRYDPMD